MAKQKERLARLWGKAWVRWLCGYLAVLFCGVGLVYYWRVIYKLGEGTPGFAATTTLIICGGFTAVFLLVLLAAHFLKQKLWLKTAVLLAIAGLCFVFANPPLQAPDETDHFVRAYAIGSGHWDFDEQETYPDDVHALVRYFNGSAAHAGEGGLLGSFARYKASLEKKDVHTGAFSNALQIVAFRSPGGGSPPPAAGGRCRYWAAVQRAGYGLYVSGALCECAAVRGGMWFGRAVRAAFPADFDRRDDEPARAVYRWFM